VEFLKGMRKTERLELKDIIGGAHRNETVQVSGMVHAKRPVGGGLTFLKLRKRDGLLQCTCGERVDVSKIPEESAVVVTGRLREEPRAPGGVELVAEGIEVLSRPAAAMPVPIPKAKLNVNLDTELGLRPVVLRHLRERSVFRVQECLGRAFRDYLRDQGFTEIHTPKIVHAGAEGGSNIFRLDYFGRKAFLAQSPQFYKQTMVGVYERVFELAPVFRAEKHSTARHLNEYTSMDFEMGFINSFEDVMAMETGFLQHAMALLREEYAQDVERLGIRIPDVSAVPCIRFDEAKRLRSIENGPVVDVTAVAQGLSEKAEGSVNNG